LRIVELRIVELRIVDWSESPINRQSSIVNRQSSITNAIINRQSPMQSAVCNRQSAISCLGSGVRRAHTARERRSSQTMSKIGATEYQLNILQTVVFAFHTVRAKALTHTTVWVSPLRADDSTRN
jgi:hypothetical protein